MPLQCICIKNILIYIYNVLNTFIFRVTFRSFFCDIANVREGWISVNCLVLLDVDKIYVTENETSDFFHEDKMHFSFKS